jgi:Tol biopolymer transport system component
MSASDPDYLSAGSLAFSVTPGRNEHPWSLVLLDLKHGQIRYLADYGNGSMAVAPQWSPDGKYLLYSMNRNCAGIFVVDIETGSIDRLDSNKTGENCQAVWSPDGKQIVYQTTRHHPETQYDLYIVELEGREHRRLTDHGGGLPAWSPDGEWIIYYSSEKGPQHFRIRPNGRDNRPFMELPDSKMRAGTPTWSPDRTKITFSAWVWADGNTKAPDWSKRQVYIADADSNNARPITQYAPYFGTPVRSPKDNIIAVPGNFSEIYGAAGIYIIENGELRELVKQNYDDRETWFMWSPDGRYIAYAPFHGRIYEGSGVYIVEIATGQIHQVSNLVAAYPVWCPSIH